MDKNRVSDKQSSNSSNNNNNGALKGDVTAVTGEKPEQPSQYEHSSCLSQWLFLWLSPLMDLGQTRPLDADDVPQLHASARPDAVTATFEAAWRKERARNPTQPSLLNAIWIAFGWRWCVSFTIACVFACCLVGSPQLVKKLLSWLEHPTPDESEGYAWAVALWGCFFTVSSCVSQMYMWNTLMGIDIRTAVMLAVFRKASRLSTAAQATAGLTSVNLMSVDAERLWQAVLISCMAITMPLLVVVCLVLMVQEVGVAALCGAGFMALMVPLQGPNPNPDPN